MERTREKFRPKKKAFKQGPTYRVFEGENQEFLSAVNEKLANLPEMTTNIRNSMIGMYGTIKSNFNYMSPIYFASAIAFLYKYPKGPTKTNFTNENLSNYVSRNFLETPASIPKSTLDLRRKTEFLRYIRLVSKINDEIKIQQQG
jgi:hypothetical protein